MTTPLHAASMHNRLYLAKAVGPCSQGTRVELNTVTGEITGKITKVTNVGSKDYPKYRRETEIVTLDCYLEDLVVRRSRVR